MLKFLSRRNEMLQRTSSAFKSTVGHLIPRPNLRQLIPITALAMQSPSGLTAGHSVTFPSPIITRRATAPSSSCSRSGSRRLLISTARTSDPITQAPGIELQFPGSTDSPVIADSGNGGAGSSGGRRGGGGGGGGGNGGGDWSGLPESGGDSSRGNILLAVWEAFLRGWRSRVRTDPQFPFKVLTEQFIGVGACVLGDMASRPNFGLNELDFVFSTVVVGSILNFTLMYMLAPASAGAQISRLPNIFAGCPPGYMFEPGAYTVVERFGTFVYKGVLFAGAGFMAGLLGTIISNVLLDARRRMDPSFTLQNEAPPTLLSAATWAAHMGVSSNLRYQALNGLEHFAAGVMTPGVFKASVFVLRAANNVLGGASFVLLARLTGAQKKKGDDETAAESTPLLKECSPIKAESRG